MTNSTYIYDEYRDPRGCFHTLMAVLVGVVITIVLCLCFPSCKTPQPIVQTVEKERIVKVNTRDTVIVTEADSASVKALVRCDSTNNALLDQLAEKDGKRIDTGVSIKKNEDGSLEIEFNCKEDSLLNEIQLRDSVISTIEKETQVVKERYVPDYYKNTSAGFWILLVILVLIVGWKIAKIYFKIQSGGIL